MPPSDKRAVRRFLKLCTYHGRFIRDFRKLSALLPHLTKDAVKFERSEEHQRSINELKRTLETPPIPDHFDQLAETDIRTGDSNTGLCAVLVQREVGGE